MKEAYYTSFLVDGEELWRVHTFVPLALNSCLIYQEKYYRVKRIVFEFEEELTNRHWQNVDIYEATQIPDGF